MSVMVSSEVARRIGFRGESITLSSITTPSCAVPAGLDVRAVTEKASATAFSAVDLGVSVLVEFARHQLLPPCMPISTVTAMHLTDS